MAALALTALAGCATKPTAPTTSNTTTNPSATTTSTPLSARYSCDIGLDVTVRHLGNSQIELTTSDGKRGVLTQAVSGSGERYTTNQGLWGNGGAWHQKGGQAYFEYVGVHGGAPKSTNCTAN